MIALSAAEVAEATGGRLAAAPEVLVTGPVVADSSHVEAGSLFVALPGEKVDGASFASGAVADGAVLVLAERELDGLPVVVVPDARAALGDLARSALRGLRSRHHEVHVFGITGSNGKTTTKDLLARLMAGEDEAETIAPRGSYNSDVGLPLTVLRATDATRHLVLEFGADRPGDIGYLSRICEPQIAIILKVGTAHIEFFGSQDAIADAKAEIMEGMAPGSTVVINADDDRVVGLTPRATDRGLRVVTFGRVPSADVRAEDVELDATGRASFTLRVRGAVAAAGEVADDVRVPVRLRLVGEHHVSNALAAATAAILAGRPPALVAERLEADAASPHRMAVTERPDGVTVIDDAYNANPESMKAALRTLAVMAGRERRSVAVLGEMRELGDAATAAHLELGTLVVRLNIDQLIVVGQGAYQIHDRAQQEGSWGEESVFAADLDAARAALDEHVHPGDVVLVKASNGTGLWRLGDELAAGTLGVAGTLGAAGATNLGESTS